MSAIPGSPLKLDLPRGAQSDNDIANHAIAHDPKVVEAREFFDAARTAAAHQQNVTTGWAAAACIAACVDTLFAANMGSGGLVTAFAFIPVGLLGGAAYSTLAGSALRAAADQARNAYRVAFEAARATFSVG